MAKNADGSWDVAYIRYGNTRALRIMVFKDGGVVLKNERLDGSVVSLRPCKTIEEAKALADAMKKQLRREMHRGRN